MCQAHDHDKGKRRKRRKRGEQKENGAGWLINMIRATEYAEVAST